MHEESKQISYVISHVAILKLIAVWGIVEAVLYWITGGDRKKEFIIHLCMFFIISFLAYHYPHLSEDLK